jgi:hypothetical protein
MSGAAAEPALLSVHLRRFRRRAALMIFVRSLLVVSSVTLVVAEAVVLWKLAAPANAFPWAAAVTVVVAALVTAARTPSQRATAAEIDRQLHLHDRVVTAVQCAASDDAFSQLVVRDAVRRMAPVKTSEAFPLRVPRAAAAAPLAIVLLILALAALPTPRGFASGGGRFTTRSAGTASTAAAGARQPGSVVTQVSVPADASQSSAGRPAPRPAASARNEASAEAQPRDEAHAPGASAGTPGITQVTGAASAAAATSPGTRADGRGAAGPGPTSSESLRAGGVSGGERARDASAPVQQGRPYAAAYRAGLADAETAIVQERIPAERRAYVREYFRAIKPQGQR